MVMVICIGAITSQKLGGPNESRPKSWGDHNDKVNGTTQKLGGTRPVGPIGWLRLCIPHIRLKAYRGLQIN